MHPPPRPTHDRIAGFSTLWEQTRGMPDICIAVLDGPVDLGHPCFAGARLEMATPMVAAIHPAGGAMAHGTHTASIIFGQPGSAVAGLAPGCRGLLIPIFSDGPDGSLTPCSQVDLARAITQAVEQGAHIINVSGGQLSASGQADQLLQRAIALCRERNVLLVAAAGNDGCDCLHIPASDPATLVVGALDSEGRPMHISNWGEAYRLRGLMAPGERIAGAVPGGGSGDKSGTSFATPIVSAVAALLLGIQLQHGDRPDPRGVGDALLRSATRCNENGDIDCRRLLTGTLDVLGAIQLILKRKTAMSDDTMIDASDAPAVTESFPQPEPALIRAAGYVAPPPALREPAPAGIDASGCGCSGGPAKGPVLVYALGTLGYDFGSESRRDSFAQAMPAPNNVPEDPKQLLAFLEEFPFYAQSLNWTLNLDATTIYAIVPSGPFAQMAYQFLINALRGTIDGTVLLNSIPGVIVGNAKMMSGQVVPVIEPAVRGMFSWSEPQLIASLMETGNLTEEPARAGLSNFLNRVYYDFRNLGIAGSDRALNYAASNVVQVLQVMGKLSGMELDTIVVQPSPICRPGSECYDIVLQFFTPSNTNIAAQVARFAVDVSDVIPVSVGPVRYWALR